MYDIYKGLVAGERNNNDEIVELIFNNIEDAINEEVALRLIYNDQEEIFLKYIERFLKNKYLILIKVYLAHFEKNNKNITKILLEKGADPNEKHSGSSPLNVSIKENNNDEIVGLLLQYGADPNLRDEGMYYLEEYPYEQGNAFISYDSYGREIFKEEKYKRLPLIEAIEKNNSRIVDLLLLHGADLNYTDYFGNKPLARAIINKM